MFKILIVTLLSLSSLNALPFKPDSKVICQNNGVGYSDGNGYAFCKCAPNTAGKQCQIVVVTTTTCAPTQRVTTTCAPIQQVTTTCATAINPCLRNPCQNGGQCFNSNGVAVCQCVYPYYGSLCQYFSTITVTATTTACPTTVSTSTSYNPCQISPCQNGGQCQNTNGFATCTCVNGYTGTYCDQGGSASSAVTGTTAFSLTNPCQISPCQHGGQCQNSNGFASCVCCNGYTGQYCQYAPSKNSINNF